MKDAILHIHEEGNQTGYVEFADAEDRTFNWRYWGNSKSTERVLNNLNGTEIVPTTDPEENDEYILVKEAPRDKDKSMAELRRVMLRLEAMRSVFAVQLFIRE